VQFTITRRSVVFFSTLPHQVDSLVTLMKFYFHFHYVQQEDEETYLVA